MQGSAEQYQLPRLYFTPSTLSQDEQLIYSLTMAPHYKIALIQLHPKVLHSHQFSLIFTPTD